MILSRIYRLHSHHHNQIVVDSPGSPDCSCLHLVVGRQRVNEGNLNFQGNLAVSLVACQSAVDSF